MYDIFESTSFQRGWVMGKGRTLYLSSVSQCPTKTTHWSRNRNVRAICEVTEGNKYREIEENEETESDACTEVRN